ncbi:hypothetical protein DPMN_039864 [Dreissena polymorpha]|uniref:Uncharacterized protein n=1 Tax=Dreissena polymorpha TaxID=45954 RepID=A0A9D4CVR7_DREPO|nr:hypothetical protein DPMN_039864 [Dreissena polymorpha]
MMGATLVDINQAVTCKVRVLNPQAAVVALKQDAEIARAERIDMVVSVLTEKENEGEESLARVRRVQGKESPVVSCECYVSQSERCRCPCPSDRVVYKINAG